MQPLRRKVVPSIPKPESFQRDSYGIAILPKPQWFFSDSGSLFLNTSTLEVVIFPKAVDPNYQERSLVVPPRFSDEQPALSSQEGPKIHEPFAPKFTQDFSEKDHSGRDFAVFKHQVQPSVFQFKCFNDHQCSTLIKEVEAAVQTNPSLPFNYMGVHIRELFPHLWTWVGAFVQALSPAFKQQNPCVHSLELLSAFFVRYTSGEGHAEHSDKTDLTINICLGKSFQGGDLVVSGESVAHQPGFAIIHHGLAEHSAQSLETGERINLIIWSKVNCSLPFWSQLANDLKQGILSYLDPRTLHAFLCTSKGASSHLIDSMWKGCISTSYPEVLKEPHYPSLFKDICPQAFHENGSVASYQRLFDFLGKVELLPALSALILSVKPQRVMKETVEMARRRQEAAAVQSTNSGLEVILSSGIDLCSLRQKLAPSKRAVVYSTWFLPPANRLTVSANPRTSDILRVFRPPQAVKDLGFSPFPVTAKPTPPPKVFSPIDRINAPVPFNRSPYLDTDGTTLTQYPWFWPVREAALPWNMPLDLGLYVSAWNEHYVLVVTAPERRSNITIRINDNKVNIENQKDLKFQRSSWNSIKELMDDAFSQNTAVALRFPSFPSMG